MVALIVLVGLAGFAFGTLLFHNLLMGLLGFAMILGSTMDLWLGSSYKLDAKGAQSRVGPSVAAIEWSDVKRILTSPRSIRLSPLEKAGPRDPFRGVLLRTQAENHAAVLEFVAANCPAESVFQETASETV